MSDLVLVVDDETQIVQIARDYLGKATFGLLPHWTDVRRFGSPTKKGLI